jgi:uncharacterized protein (DUF1778 family)
MNHQSTLRGVTISIRAKQNQRDLIDQAAEVAGKNRSDFMLEAACREAEGVLLDRTYFALEGKAFETFKTLIDKALPPGERLRRKMLKKAPWE